MSIKAQNENEEMVSELTLSNNSTLEQYGGKVDPEGSCKKDNLEPVNELIRDISRLRNLFDRKTTNHPSANLTLRVMFGKDIRISHAKSVVLVLDRLLKNWEAPQ